MVEGSELSGWSVRSELSGWSVRSKDLNSKVWMECKVEGSELSGWSVSRRI